MLTIHPPWYCCPSGGIYLVVVTVKFSPPPRCHLSCDIGDIYIYIYIYNMAKNIKSRYQLTTIRYQSIDGRTTQNSGRSPLPRTVLPTCQQGSCPHHKYGPTSRLPTMLPATVSYRDWKTVHLPPLLQDVSVASHRSELVSEKKHHK